MLGVTIFSIILNIILKRLEFEKKLRFISQKLKEELFKIAVKSDVLTCRRLYEYFLLMNDEDSFRTQLMDGNPVNWFPIRNEDPDLRYSKQLITMEALTILKKRGKNAIKEEIINMGFFEKCLRKCCCIKEKKEMKIEFDLLENALKMVRFNEQLLIADDYLSNKFKRKNVEFLQGEKDLNIYEFIQEKQENKEKYEENNDN